MTPERIDAALPKVEARLDPAGRQAIAIVLDRLFAVVAMPSEEALAVWNERLADRYPPWLLMRAVDHLIDTHRYPSPPQLAELVKRCEDDFDYQRLIVGYHRMQLARSEIERRTPRLAPPPAPTEAEKAETLAAVADLKRSIAERSVRNAAAATERRQKRYAAVIESRREVMADLARRAAENRAAGAKDRTDPARVETDA